AEEVFLQHSPDSIIGRKVTDVIANSPLEDIEQVFATGETIVRERFKSLRFEKYYTVSYTALKKMDEVYAVMVVTHDITETIKRKLELERMNDELESFARISSHDLQEPLRNIQTFCDR